MKRISVLLLVTFIIVAISGKAKDYDREFKKIIERYDVPTEVRYLKGHDAGEFWNTLVGQSASYNKFCEEILRNKGAEKEAMHNVELLPRFNPEYVDWVDNSAQAYCDSLSNILSLNGILPGFKLYFTNLEEPYSCSALGEETSYVIVDKGLLNCKGFNEKMLLGIIAHEYTHCILQHRLHNEYNQARKKRRDRLANSIIAGAVGVATFTAVATVSDGVSRSDGVYIDNSVNVNMNHADNVREITPYNYIFPKHQMLQADLVAYRLLEYLGYGGEEYINLLRLLEKNQYQPDEYENYILETGIKEYPTLRYRILFLEYVSKHPEIKNKLC